MKSVAGKEFGMLGNNFMRRCIDINDEQAVAPCDLFDALVEERNAASQFVTHERGHDRSERNVRQVGHDDRAVCLRLDVLDDLLIIARESFDRDAAPHVVNAYAERDERRGWRNRRAKLIEQNIIGGRAAHAQVGQTRTGPLMFYALKDARDIAAVSGPDTDAGRIAERDINNRHLPFIFHTRLIPLLRVGTACPACRPGYYRERDEEREDALDEKERCELHTPP